jgi:hypothetical protein
MASTQLLVLRNFAFCTELSSRVEPRAAVDVPISAEHTVTISDRT